MNKKDDTYKKPIKKAAALKYDAATDNAPYVVAVGNGEVAEQIIDRAHLNNVQIMKDEKLASVLSRLSVGDEIPEELYAVVAQILIFISDLDHECKNRFGMG